ncbi:hypothetical protein [Streptomyces sp. NPDC001478]
MFEMELYKIMSAELVRRAATERLAREARRAARKARRSARHEDEGVVSTDRERFAHAA